MKAQEIAKTEGLLDNKKKRDKTKTKVCVCFYCVILLSLVHSIGAFFKLLAVSVYASDFQPGFREHLPRVLQLACSKMTLLANSRQTCRRNAWHRFFFLLEIAFLCVFFCIDLMC